MTKLKFGIGEIVDRLSILSLKILYYSRRGKATAHLREELDDLLDTAGGRVTNAPHIIELSIINAVLWRDVDRMEELLAMSPSDSVYKEAGVIGLRIVQLNNQRNALIDAINKAAGELKGPEKG